MSDKKIGTVHIRKWGCCCLFADADSKFKVIFANVTTT